MLPGAGPRDAVGRMRSSTPQGSSIPLRSISLTGIRPITKYPRHNLLVSWLPGVSGAFLYSAGEFDSASLHLTRGHSPYHQISKTQFACELAPRQIVSWIFGGPALCLRVHYTTSPLPNPVFFFLRLLLTLFYHFLNFSLPFPFSVIMSVCFYF